MGAITDKARMKNPAKKRIQFNGEKGLFYFYDKEQATEDDKSAGNVFLDYPFIFMPIADRYTVTGYNPNTEKRIFANEVDSISDDVMLVRAFGSTGNTIIAQGTYPSIKKKVNDNKGKFTINLYIIMKNPETKVYDINTISFSGSQVSEWFDFLKNFELYSCAVKITGAKEMKSGGIKYKVPVFEKAELEPSKLDELKNLATEKYREHLSPYFEDVSTRFNEKIDQIKTRKKNLDHQEKEYSDQVNSLKDTPEYDNEPNRGFDDEGNFPEDYNDNPDYPEESDDIPDASDDDLMI